MLNDYAAVGSQELWNTTRLQAYLTNVGSPFDTGPGICNCEALTPELIGGTGTTYDTPATDPAPWYDPDYDHSGEFLGFLPLTIGGLEDNPRARNVTNAVTGGGIFGRAQELPRTITVSGVLIGTSCCGVDYGLHYLSEVLSECVGDCEGSCLTMYSCCPDDAMTEAEFNAKYRRTFRRTALVSGPVVTNRSATGGGSCSTGTCSGSDLLEVEFVLVAGIPWPWTDPLPSLSVPFPLSGEEASDCVEWCLTLTGGTCEGEVCLHQDCDRSAACADPLNPVVQPPRPSLPSTTFCIPLAPERACYTIDLTDRPRWSSDVPMITVYSGDGELRNARITFYERSAAATSCDEYVDSQLCAPVNDFVITYMPPHSTITIDGQTGQATINCLQGDCSPANVFGNDNGGPVKITPMSCAMYCVCLSTDNAIPSPDGTLVTIDFSGRGL